jgi:hypothetical protein
MPYEYQDTDTLHTDVFDDFSAWHHEGVGAIEPAPDGGMRLHCFGSHQGGRGCMAFFRPTLPDSIAVEYELAVRSHGGLVINYLAIRGMQGEDLIEDRDQMEPRTAKMKNYYGLKWGLQSYHVSVSRFDDRGEHTGTSNWRRNPGCALCGHGVDQIREIDRWYRIRLTKDAGHCQLYVDGDFAHGFVDRDASRFPIPDTGKFGFRLIGSDVMVDVRAFRVHRVQLEDRDRNELWKTHENEGL